jgi:hypothetical protein
MSYTRKSFSDQAASFFNSGSMKSSDEQLEEIRGMEMAGCRKVTTVSTAFGGPFRICESWGPKKVVDEEQPPKKGKDIFGVGL